MDSLVVNNLTILGEITFPDYSTQNTSYSQFLKQFNIVTRDELNNKTYFTTDDIIIEKNVTMPSNVGMNTMTINAITFANDYLQTGFPSTQTYAFTNQMYTDLTGTKQKLDSLEADHFDRPNKRIRVSEPDKNVLIGSDFISLNNTFLRPASLLGSVSNNFVVGRGNALPRITFGSNFVKINADEDDAYGSIVISNTGALLLKPATNTVCEGPLVVAGGINLEGTNSITGSAEIYTPSLISPTFSGTVSGLTKTMVGLGNVDNTSDSSKPISTASQTALNLKANVASPTFTGTTNAAALTISNTILDPFNVIHSSTLAGFFLGNSSFSSQLNPFVDANNSVIIAKGVASTSSRGTGQGNGILTISCWGASNLGLKITCSETETSTNVWQDNGNRITSVVGSSQLIQTSSKFSMNKDTDITGTLKVFGSSNVKAITSLVHDGVNLSTLYIDSPSGGSAFTIKVNKSDNTIDDALLINANATRIKKPILPDYNVQPSSISHLGWVGLPINLTVTKTQPITSSNTDETYGNFSISQSGFFRVTVQVQVVVGINHTYDACRFGISETAGTFPSISTPEKWTHSLLNDVNAGMSTTSPNIYYLRSNILNTANTPYYLNYRLTWSGGSTCNMSANYTAVRIG
jgi:hypothetical protein